MASWRSYTDQEKAAAVGRALAVGTKQAAAELRIPRRTVSSWLQAPPPGVQGAIVESREAVAGSFWRVISEGTDAMLGRIRDPKTRAGEIAAIVRTAVESHALISGGPTSRTESTVSVGPRQSEEEREQVREWLDAVVHASDEELAEWAASGGLAQIRAVERAAQPHLYPEEAVDDVG